MEPHQIPNDSPENPAPPIHPLVAALFSSFRFLWSGARDGFLVWLASWRSRRGNIVHPLIVRDLIGTRPLWIILGVLILVNLFSIGLIWPFNIFLYGFLPGWSSGAWISLLFPYTLLSPSMILAFLVFWRFWMFLRSRRFQQEIMAIPDSRPAVFDSLCVILVILTFFQIGIECLSRGVYSIVVVNSIEIQNPFLFILNHIVGAPYHDPFPNEFSTSRILAILWNPVGEFFRTLSQMAAAAFLMTRFRVLWKSILAAVVFAMIFQGIEHGSRFLAGGLHQIILKFSSDVEPYTLELLFSNILNTIIFSIIALLFTNNTRSRFLSPGLPIEEDSTDSTQPPVTATNE